jgi:hypothetical protein
MRPDGSGKVRTDGQNSDFENGAAAICGRPWDNGISHDVRPEFSLSSLGGRFCRRRTPRDFNPLIVFLSPTSIAQNRAAITLVANMDDLKHVMLGIAAKTECHLVAYRNALRLSAIKLAFFDCLLHMRCTFDLARDAPWSDPGPAITGQPGMSAKRWFILA